MPPPRASNRQAPKKYQPERDEDINALDNMDVDDEEQYEQPTTSAQDLIASMVEGVSANALPCLYRSPTIFPPASKTNHSLSNANVTSAKNETSSRPTMPQPRTCRTQSRLCSASMRRRRESRAHICSLGRGVLMMFS